MILAERLAELIDHPDIDVRSQALEMLRCWGEVSPLVAQAVRYGEVPLFQPRRGAKVPPHSIRKVRHLIEVAYEGWHNQIVTRARDKAPLDSPEMVRLWDAERHAVHMLNLMMKPIGRRHRMDLVGAATKLSRSPLADQPLRDLCLYIAALATVPRKRAPLIAARWLLAHVSAQEAA